MKKNSLVLICVLSSLFSFAQGKVTTLTNSKGQEILPQAKDWAIQYDASPMLNFLGNAFSSGTISPSTISPFSKGVFVAKRFINASSAYRFKFGFNISRVTNDTFIPYGTNQDYIESRITSVNNIILGFGKEWRRGHGRLQGVYGFEGLAQIGSSTPYQSKKYNLTIKQAVDTGVHPSGVNRSLGVTKSRAFGIGIRSFAGIEYFILPKISIGGEFGWGIGYQLQRHEITQESYITEIKTEVSNGNRVSNFVISNDEGGSIFGGSASFNLTFHF